MADRYTLFGFLTLESGAWADWFSGAASFAAVVVALGGYWFSELTRRHEQKQRDLEIGRAIGWKLIRILNSSHDFYRHFWLQPDPNMKGFSGQVEAWRSTFPLVGTELDSTLSLGAAEEALLMKAKASELLMQFSLVYPRYVSIVRSTQEYKNRFDIIQSLMPTPIAAEGIRVTHGVNAETALKLHPHSLQLDSILQGIRELTLENVKSCLQMLKLMDKFYADYFGKVLFRFEPDESVGNPENLGNWIPRSQ